MADKENASAVKVQKEFQESNAINIHNKAYENDKNAYRYFTVKNNTEKVNLENILNNPNINKNLNHKWAVYEESDSSKPTDIEPANHILDYQVFNVYSTAADTTNNNPYSVNLTKANAYITRDAPYNRKYYVGIDQRTPYIIFDGYNKTEPRGFAMGISANKVADRIFDNRNTKFEWLHLSAHQFGIGITVDGMQTSPESILNFVLGTENENNRMGIVEDAIRNALKTINTQNNIICKCHLTIHYQCYYDKSSVVKINGQPKYPTWLAEELKYHVLVEYDNKTTNKAGTVYNHEFIFKPLRTLKPSQAELASFDRTLLKRIQDNINAIESAAIQVTKTVLPMDKQAVPAQSSMDIKNFAQILGLDNFISEQLNWFLFENGIIELLASMEEEDRQLWSFHGILQMAGSDSNNPLLLLQEFLGCASMLPVQGHFFSSSSDETKIQLDFATITTELSVNKTFFGLITLEKILLQISVSPTMNENKETTWRMEAGLVSNLSISGLSSAPIEMEVQIIYQDKSLYLAACGNDVEDFLGISNFNLDNFNLTFAIGATDSMHVAASFIVGDLNYAIDGFYSSKSYALGGSVEGFTLQDLDDLYENLMKQRLSFLDTGLLTFEEVFFAVANDNCSLFGKEIPKGITFSCTMNMFGGSGNVLINISSDGAMINGEMQNIELDQVLRFDEAKITISLPNKTSGKKMEMSFEGAVTIHSGDEEILTINTQIDYDAASKKYCLQAQIKDSLHLSDLPLVGHNLHLLDGLSIDKITLACTSADGKVGDYNVKKGLSFGFTFCNEQYVFPVFSFEDTQGKGIQKISALEKMDTNEMTAFQWFDINRDISLVSIYRLGIGLIKDKLVLMFDASLHITPLLISLEGLGAGISLSDPSDFSFRLSGLELQYNKAPLIIDGMLERNIIGADEVYNGMILLKFSKFSVMAIASYSNSNNALFAYAAVNAPFGGPPMLFVTGIAAGFGYNENITLPEIQDVSSYPLIEGATGKITQEALAPKLAAIIKPQKGQYFFAAGVKFTTFKVIDSFVLLTLELGTETEVGLLGISEVSVPFNASSSDAIAHAELALKASFSPKKGVFVQAQLTNDSYILSKSCHLTGGFAFCTWFDADHSGDYVITLGGYHPAYKKPAHYPDVPRLGFSWNVGGGLKLSGQAYFALTPRAVMAGGRLDGSFHCKPVTAWFTISADILLQWKPLFYSIRMHVGFGVKVDLWLFSVNLELSAGLEIWGPEFSGYAKVKCIATFTIHFGAHASQVPPLVSWDDFKTAFLPQQDGRIAMNAIHIAEGLIKETTYCGKKVSIVHSHGLVITTQSVIPCTSLTLNGQNIPEVADKNTNVYIHPMEKTLQSNQIVSVKKDGQEIAFDVVVEAENLSASLWGQTNHTEELVKNVATGLRLIPKEREQDMGIELYPKTEGKYIDLEQLAIAERFHRKYGWMNPAALPGAAAEQNFNYFETCLMSTEVRTKRRQWLSLLTQNGYDLGLIDVDLTQLKDHANEVYTENVWLGQVV